MSPLLQLALGSTLTLAVASAAVELRRAIRGPSATMQNMRERALSWWLLLTVGVPALQVPRPGATLLFGGLTAFCVHELLQANSASGALRRQWLYLVVPLFALALDSQSVLLGGFTLSMAVGLLSRHPKRCILLTLGLGLCAAGMGSLLLLAQMEGSGPMLLLLAIVVTQGSDSLQYVFGKLFGHHQLAPRLSPAKTWEGLLYGGLSAAGIGTALALRWGLSETLALSLSFAAVATGAAGGLLMSAFKRHLGIKDWGNTLKGHGGILDRVDSLLLTAPLFLTTALLTG